MTESLQKWPDSSVKSKSIRSSAERWWFDFNHHVPREGSNLGPDTVIYTFALSTYSERDVSHTSSSSDPKRSMSSSSLIPAAVLPVVSSTLAGPYLPKDFFTPGRLENKDSTPVRLVPHPFPLLDKTQSLSFPVTICSGYWPFSTVPGKNIMCARLFSQQTLVLRETAYSILTMV